MRIDEVPQDRGMITEEHGGEVCYAVDDSGKYTISKSAGWDVKNIVNDQAWDVIVEETRKCHQQVVNGEKSPIVFWAAKNQMDLSLLSNYVEIAKWRVKRHLKPNVFNRLGDKMLEEYAYIFGISVNELKNVPEKFIVEEVFTSK